MPAAWRPAAVYSRWPTRGGGTTRDWSPSRGGAAAPARLATLVVSDVVGSPLAAIAGGTTVPDPTTYADALGILEAGGITVPRAVLAVLRQGAEGRRPETPKGGPAFAGPVVVVADGAAAARGAAEAAAVRGIAARVCSTTVEGEAPPGGRRGARRAGPRARARAAAPAARAPPPPRLPGRQRLLPVPGRRRRPAA